MTITFMDEAKSKFRIMYEENPMVTNDTFLEWFGKNRRLRKDDLFISKIKTMKLTKSIADKYMRVYSEMDYYIACGGNMNDVAQLILSDIMNEMTLLQ
jgi:hypothetical protein